MTRNCPTCNRPMVPKVRAEFPYPLYHAAYNWLKVQKRGASTKMVQQHFDGQAPRYIQNVLTWLRKHGYAENPQHGYWKAI